MANITIDGKQLTVKDGITIIEAIDQMKGDLPRYCYHPGLSIAGNCRICQVEVEKMPRTVIACNTRVAEGMVISTNSPKAKESQQIVLEFLLANHPLDCPVCDQAGECKLQDYYMDYGLYDSKMNDVKVKKTKKAVPVGPTIMLDQERCILCTRCVRFGDEVTKTHDFGVFNRGDHSELDIMPGKELNNNYSGNVADICPVGALTDRDFRFKMRVWYLGEQQSVCNGCSNGCNTFIHYEKSRPYHLKNERVMRLKPRENQDVNKWWMCDIGRYGYKSIDKGRLKMEHGPTNGTAPELKWAALLDKVAGVLKSASVGSWAVLASPHYTNEDLYLKKRLFKDHLGWKQMAFKAPAYYNGPADDFLLKADKTPNTAGASQILKLDAQNEDMAGLLEKAKRGEIEGLFIFNHDIEALYGAETLKTLRAKVKTILFEGANENSTSRIADIVLPSASYAEKDGTFTNFQGRVQRIRKAFEPIPDAKPTHAILLELGRRLGFLSTYNRVEEIFNDLARENDAFHSMTYKTIGAGGAVWNRK